MLSGIRFIQGDCRALSSTSGPTGYYLSPISRFACSLGTSGTVCFSAWRKIIFRQRYPYPTTKASGTKKLVTRSRSKEDERIVKIKLTSEGQSLQKKAASIPKQLFEDMKVPEEELKQLKTTIEKY